MCTSHVSGKELTASARGHGSLSSSQLSTHEHSHYKMRLLFTFTPSQLPCTHVHCAIRPQNISPVPTSIHIHFIGPEQSETPPTRTRPNGRAASGIFHINRWRINNNMTGRALFIQLPRCCRLPAALLYSAARSNQQLCRQPTLL